MFTKCQNMLQGTSFFTKLQNLFYNHFNQINSESIATFQRVKVLKYYIAPDKAAYCVFTLFRGPEKAIKFISVPTKTQ